MVNELQTLLDIYREICIDIHNRENKSKYIAQNIDNKLVGEIRQFSW